jgi:hypothetical protein
VLTQPPDDTEGQQQIQQAQNANDDNRGDKDRHDTSPEQVLETRGFPQCDACVRAQRMSVFR